MTKAYLVSEEVLRQVLDALEDFNEQSKHGVPLPAEIDYCMDLFRTVLAKEPQEPSGEMKTEDADGNDVWIPLYKKEA